MKIIEGEYAQIAFQISSLLEVSNTIKIVK